MGFRGRLHSSNLEPLIPPKANIVQHGGNVLPKADISQLYSITSSVQGDQ
jgi:hypothetical protein